MVLYAMACRLWVSETAGLSDGITGTYVTQHMTMCQYGEDRGDLLLLLFKSLAFLAISDRYTTLFFWTFLTKWLLSVILDVRNSLWIAFLPFQIDRPFWISEID